MVKERPEILSGKTLRAPTNCGYFYLTLNNNEGELFEVKMELGKSGTCVRGLVHFIGVLFSILLQQGVDKKQFKKMMSKHLVKMNCGGNFAHSGNEYTSCMDWVAEKIIRELENNEKV